MSGPPELEERYRRFLEGRGDDVAPLLCLLRGGRHARAGMEAWAALILSRIYLLRGAVDLASAYLHLASSRSGGAPAALRLGILVNHALVRRARGHPAAAAGLLRAVVDAALRSGETFVAAKAASNAALSLVRLGRPGEACSYAGLAERVYESMRDGEGLVRISLTRALVEMTCGRGDEAIDRLARTLDGCRGMARERERLAALLLLGEAYISRSEYERAGQALELAGAMKDALGRFAPQRVRLLRLREIVHRSAGDDAAARACAETAAAIRRARGLGPDDAEGPDARRRGYEPASRAASRAAEGARGTHSGVMRPSAGEDLFVTRDPRTSAILDRIRRASRFDAALLIRGESGVGKDLVARLVHRWSGREGRPYVAVNAASIPAELFESVLFGHARGAFTGAVNQRPGLVGAAADGTIFLDEIGELPPALQPKLLRFIDGGEFFALGETMPRRSAARIVCATNRDLEAACEAGSFRRDLYHRIAALSFSVPPLRERRRDIPLLAEHLLDRARLRHGFAPLRLDAGAIAALESFDWPGNARELESVLLDAALHARGGFVRACDLAPAILARARARAAAPGDLRACERSLRRERIAAALRECGGNRTRTAACLGIKRTTLIGIMKRLEIV